MQNTMKIKFIILMLAMVGYFTSCYDDKSNDSIKTINPLVIDMGGSTHLDVSLFVGYSRN